MFHSALPILTFYIEVCLVKIYSKENMLHSDLPILTLYIGTVS